MRHPLISYNCITKNNAFHLARRIDCFLAQTSTNKEFLVVYEYFNKTVPLIKPLYEKDSRIRFFQIPKTYAKIIGTTCNISIEASQHKHFGQRDDDDWYSEDKLSADHASEVPLSKKLLRQQQKAIVHTDQFRSQHYYTELL